MLAVLIVPVKLSMKRISKVVPIVFALFGSPGPAEAESAVETIAGIVIAVGVPLGPSLQVFLRVQQQLSL